MYYMPKTLTESEQEMWDKLKYVHPKTSPKPWAYSAGTAPPSPTSGSIYFNLLTKEMMIYDGTTWNTVIE